MKYLTLRSQTRKTIHMNIPSPAPDFTNALNARASFAARCIVLLLLIGGLSHAENIPQPKSPSTSPDNPPVYDLVVYGDSSGAVTAAISAKRDGRSVVLVNPIGFLGGMSSSGLGATDFLGKRSTFGGIASEFYDGVAAAYGKDYVRSFEPHVGKEVFEKLIKDAGVTVVYNEMLDRTPGKGVTMNGKRIESITTLSGKTYRGRMFIDATYVGDLMAAAGVTYTVGREPESQYGEDMAGVRRGDTKPRVHYTQGDKDHFTKDVDPFIKPGDPESGLLPRVFKIDGLTNGQGDKKIQAYNYRVCLTTDPTNRIPIEKPAGYREIDHELLLRNFEAGDTRLPALIEPLEGPGKKVDWNNMHAVGSDYAGANWEYPEASYERRLEIEKAHENYIRGFLWTMGNSPRVPENIRTKTAAFGLPKDEFADNGGWPWMIYIREARRMVADYVMTQLDCEGVRTAPDPIGLGSFGMDSHCVQHIVTDDGKVQNEGVIWRVPPRPYGISYRAIIPKKGECENLFSPVCLSASHVAHGSIRMEPVFMALSQSAAIAAGLAIDNKLSVQDVSYAELRERLEAAKQIVRPEAWKRSQEKKKPARKETSATSPGNTTDKPNIVLILADDLGVECLSSYGGTSHRTPNIDRLAKEGMRFTRCFTNPYCSPSRATLLTGRYPFQNGLKVVLHSKYQEKTYLHPSQPSFVRQLKQHGYATQLVGKWHVSFEHKHNTIQEFGFDHYQTWNIFDQNGQKTTRFWNPHLMRDGRMIADEIKDRYGPDVDLEVYLDFIKNSAKNNQPFLAYYSTCLPHFPWEPTPDSVDKTYRQPTPQHKGDPKYFPEMLAYLDKQIGTMLQTLDELGIADNTIVLFLADNGTDRNLVNTWGDGKKIAGGKGTQTDRGTHVPLIVRWPGRIQPGSTCQDLIDLSDFLPTLCELTGAKLPEQTIHGRSFSPQLFGKPGNPREWIHRQNSEDRQVRNSNYMLNNKDQLRRVVELWEDPAKPNENRDPEKEAAARKVLQSAFDSLGK
ncbi:MAG: FAD-dependent oxidoreductase [Akkermansiaceae bacterium]